jgi:hypothetical protein
MSVQKYFLSSHTYCCQIDGEAVFLDLRRGKYLGLSHEHAAALSRLVVGWPSYRDIAEGESNAEAALETGGLAHALLELGLLTDTKSSGRPAAEIPVQYSTAVSFEGRRELATTVTALELARFAIALIRSISLLRFGRMQAIVRSIQRSRTRLRNVNQISSEMAMQHLLRIFVRIRPWAYTAHDACLLDSLSLVHFLHSHGTPAEWVIGVRMRPFGAHCWARFEGLILNDTVEHVEEFTPIIAV